MSDKFSVAMIVRNCAEILDRCLESARRLNPDEIVVVNTAASGDEKGRADTSLIAEKHGARVEYFPWNGSFADARNFSFDQCSHETVMWIDSDDTIGEPESFERHIREFAKSSANALDVAYFYEWSGKPGESNVTTNLRRERVVKRSQFRWKSPIHEVLLCKGRLNAIQVPAEEAHVIQHLTKDVEDPKPKLIRNLEIFEQQWPDGDCESRMKFYWGNTLKGLAQLPQAIEKYQSYLEDRTVAPMERLVALGSISDCFRKMGQPAHALKYALKGVTQEPGVPSPWMHAAEACFSMRDFRRAKQYADEALRRKHMAQYEMVSNPASLAARPHFISAVYSMEVRNDAHAAMESANKAAEVFPEDQGVIRLCSQIASVLNHQKTALAFNDVCTEISAVDDDLAEKIAQAAPGKLKFDPSMQRFWKVPFNRAPTPKLAIMCGSIGIEGFDHTSLVKGISGSEEATIHVSREFAKMGWDVDIYNHRETGTEDGPAIRYLPYSCWREDHPYDAVIYWRMPDGPRAFPIEDAVKILWLHDIIQVDQCPHGFWEDFDRIFCLTNYHREATGMGVAGDKVYITRNGMDVESMPEVPEKDMDMVIWPSDPSRGLVNLMEIWDELKKVRQGLHLHVLYGFTAMYDMHMQAELAQGNPFKKQVKDAVLEFGKRDDCTLHGMVPQSECHDLMAKAGWWLYPTEWPESSCITAMKAMLLGCRSIVTDSFALSETLRHGIRVPYDGNLPEFVENFKNVVMEVMRDPSKMDDDVREGMEWARALRWGSVAEDWDLLIREEAESAGREIPQPMTLSLP